MPEEQLSTYDFPPEHFVFEDFKLTFLGMSDKTDLIGLAAKIYDETIQAIYCDRHGNLYEVVFSKENSSQGIYASVMATRPRPD